MRHRFTSCGLPQFVFTILIIVLIAATAVPSLVRAEDLEKPCGTSIKTFAQIARTFMPIDKTLAQEILEVANGTRRIVGRVASAVPEGHAVTLDLGDQIQQGSKTFVVVQRSVRKVDPRSKESANSTGLAAAIAIVENGKFKMIHLEQGARNEAAAELLAKEKKLLKRTGVTTDKIYEHVKEFVQTRYANGELDIPGLTSITKSELPLFTLMRISKIGHDTWIVRARTSMDFAVAGQVSRPGDPGRMTIGVTAIINRNGEIAVLPDQSRQQLQAQGYKMSKVLDGGMPVQDLARAQERLGFRVAAVHDQADGLQIGEFQSYSPANYRVTVAFEKDLRIHKLNQRFRKTETVYVEGSYSSRWGLIMPTNLPRLNHLRRPDAPRKNILEIQREREAKAAARADEKRAKEKKPQIRPESEPQDAPEAVPPNPAPWWQVLEPNN